MDKIQPSNQLHPVQSVLKQRLKSGSKPQERKDRFKVGLVVEGGGMKGAVTGAMLNKLSKMGLKDCFDVVYGSSAGAINSTYFLSDQAEAANIYTEDICNKEFLDLMRLININGVTNQFKDKNPSLLADSEESCEQNLLADSEEGCEKGAFADHVSPLDEEAITKFKDTKQEAIEKSRPKENKLAIEAFNQAKEQPNYSLNLDILLEDVMETVKPLDYDKVLNSKIPLKAVSSSLTALNSVLLENFQSKEQLKKALKASACVPVVAGDPIEYEIDGVMHKLVDAAVFEIIPFVSAIRDGCTHALVLCSRPPNLGNFYI